MDLDGQVGRAHRRLRGVQLGLGRRDAERLVPVDEVGGAHHPYTKMEYGADGEATPVSTTNPMPVTLTLPAGQTEQPVVDETVGNLLWRILQMLMSPMGFDKSLQRQRGTVLIESGTVTTVTTVTTCATLTNQTNFGGMNADMLVRAQVNSTWGANVRSRIT